MSKELDSLKSAFRAQQNVKAKPKAKADALSAAMRAFELEKNSAVFQETSDEKRLIKQGGKQSNLSNWRRIMNTINSRWAYSLAGSASIAVLAMVLVGPNITDILSVPNEYETSQLDTYSASPEAKTAISQDQTMQNSSQGGLLSLDTDSALSKKTRNRALMKVAPTSSYSGQSMAESMAVSRPQPVEQPLSSYQSAGRDKFEVIETNPLKVVSEHPVSTFSVDVDTASYAFMRSSLNNNVLPQKDAIRVEELINYFDYGYEAPTDHAEPFKATVEIMPTPWNQGTKLMSIGIKGYKFETAEQPSSNLVFLIDTSGSMNAPNKLPLLRNSFKLLLSSLKPDDTISIVTYAGSAGTVLEPTLASEKAKILAALDNLNAGGSTAGAEGIRQAYMLAESSIKKDGVNRVILATDGDFNVGISNPSELQDFVERKRETGVTLSVLGFGRGNYNDALMQTLAQNGNGNAAYIDTLSEARKVLVDEVGSTLFNIASDVKLQVEFNPALVSEYRLIGYETRALKREDFNNDKVDAGDIGAGHTVTALYEITPSGSEAQLVDDLRYGEADASEARNDSDEYGFLKIRYKLPGEANSQLITTPITTGDESGAISGASADARFAASVAGFGQLLRGGEYTGSYTHDDVIALAQGAKGDDPFGYRAEFINLVRLAKTASKLEPLKQ